MIDRFQAEQVMGALCGGASPSTGDAPIFSKDGWQFKNIYGAAGWLSVKAMGAIGDGVADDTAAIQLALDESLFVLFPEGEYLITTGLGVREGTWIIGCGLSSIITANSITGMIQATFVDTFRLMNITLDNGGSDVGVILVENSVGSFRVEDVNFRNMDTGIQLDAGKLISIGNIYDTVTTEIVDNATGVTQITKAGEIYPQAGTSTNPIYSWFVEKTLGIYRAASGVMGVRGKLRFFNSTDVIEMVNGGASAPSYTFKDELTLGLYRISAGIAGFVGGFLRLGDRLQLPNGSSGSPALQFTNETGMGIHRIGAGAMGVVATTTRVSAELEVDGVFNHDGSTFGALNATPQSQQTKPSVPGAASAGTGIDNAQAGNVYATVADLNAAITQLNDLITAVQQDIDRIGGFGFYS